jgi:hypothetical protein
MAGIHTIEGYTYYYKGTRIHCRDIEHQRMKRQRRKAQRVLAGQEETRSRRKRTLKKQRRLPGADLQGATDVPMELQQLYRAEGVGQAAAALKELSEIWLTKEPPCTPRERAVEMRVQERAFAERWRVEKRIRVRRWERGPGYVPTEEERPQEMADDAWLAEHGMQRHELSQVDRMAQIISQWDWESAVRTPQSKQRRQAGLEGLRAVLDPACERKQVAKLAPLQERSPTTPVGSVTMNLSEIHYIPQSAQDEADRQNERDQERHQLRFQGAEIPHRLPRTPSVRRTPSTPQYKELGGLGSPCVVKNGLAQSIGEARTHGGRQLTRALAAHTCMKCGVLIGQGDEQWHLTAQQSRRTDNIYHCVKCGPVEDYVYRTPGWQEVQQERLGRYAGTFNWDRHIPEVQRRAPIPDRQVNRGYVQYPQRGELVPMEIDAWTVDRARRADRLVRADRVVELPDQPRLCVKADQSPEMKAFTETAMRDIGTRRLVQALDALGMAPSMDQLVTVSTSHLPNDFARRLGLVRDCMVNQLAETLTDRGGQYWDPTDPNPSLRAVGLLRQLPSFDGWTLQPPQFPGRVASEQLLQVTAEADEDFLISQCGHQANSRATDNRFVAAVEQLRDLSSNEREDLPDTEEAIRYVDELRRYYRECRAFAARAEQDHKIFKEMDLLYHQTHHTLVELEDRWKRHMAQGTPGTVIPSWEGDKVPLYRAIAQGMQRQSTAETEQARSAYSQSQKDQAYVSNQEKLADEQQQRIDDLQIQVQTMALEVQAQELYRQRDKAELARMTELARTQTKQHTPTEAPGQSMATAQGAAGAEGRAGRSQRIAPMQVVKKVTTRSTGKQRADSRRASESEADSADMSAEGDSDGSEDSRLGNPVEEAKFFGQELIAILRKPKAVKLGEHIYSTITAYRAAVDRCLDARIQVPQLPAWDMPAADVEANTTYLLSTAKHQRRDNLGLYPLPQTRVKMLIWGLMTTRIQTCEATGEQVVILPNIPKEHMMGIITGTIMEEPDETGYAVRAGTTAAGKPFYISSGGRRCSTSDLIDDTSNMTYNVKGQAEHRATVDTMAGDTKRRARPTCVWPVFDENTPMSGLPLTIKVKNSHGDGSRIALLTYDKDRGYYLETIRALMRAGQYPKANALEGPHLTKRSTDEEIRGHIPNKRALSRLIEENTRRREAGRYCPFVTSSKGICESMEQLLDSNEYRDMVQLYGLDVTDPRMATYAGLQEMTEEMVLAHQRSFAEQENTKARAGKEGSSSSGSDFSIGTGSDSETSSNEDSTESSEEERSERSRDSFISRDSFMSKGRHSGTRRAVSDIRPATNAISKLGHRSREREQRANHSRNTMATSNFFTAHMQTPRMVEDTRSIEDRPSRRRSKTELMRDDELAWTTALATSVATALAATKTSQGSPSRERAEPLAPQRERELRAYADKQENHTNTEATTSAALKLLREHTYETTAGSRFSKPALVVRANELWHTEYHTPIYVYLLERLTRWEEHGVNMIEVAGMLYRGDNIVSPVAQGKEAMSPLSLWHGVRDSQEWRQPRRDNWKLHMESGIAFTPAETDFLLRRLIQIFLERYCDQFYVPVNALVIRKQIAGIRMKSKGDRREIHTIHAELLALHRLLDEKNKATLEVYETFMEIIEQNGGEPDPIRDGILMRQEIEMEVNRIRTENPGYTTEVALQKTVFKIRKRYQDVEALNKPIAREAGKEGRPARDRGGTRNHRVNMLTTPAQEADESNQLGQMETMRIAMQHMQELYMSGTQGKDNRSQSKKGSRSQAYAGQATSRSQVYAAQATPGYCPSCGCTHGVGCRFIKNGSWDMPAYIDWIVSDSNPDRLMRRIFSEDWPRSTLHRTKGDKEQMELRKAVQTRRGNT